MSRFNESMGTVCVLLGSMLSAAHAADTGTASPPATVQQYSDELSLATVTLTPEAEQRLGIETAEARKERVRRTRLFGGAVVLPPGRSITVFAPTSGTLMGPPSQNGKIPVAGSAVKAGEPILAFLPFLSPERSVLTPSERVQLAEARVTLATAKIEAEGRLDAARVELDAAKVEHDRAVQLLQDKVGSERSVAEAKARLDLAQKNWEAARIQKQTLDETTLDAEAGTLASTSMESPVDGILNNLYGSVGQTVAAGAPLFEVVNQETVWVRIPVYVGDLAKIATEEPVQIGGLTATHDRDHRPARPVTGPPTANPAAATVDLYYEIENQDDALRAGQRVGVIVQLRAEEESLVVPWDAILHDIHGGAWVYERVADHAYRRSRVQVHHVAGETAVLAEGPVAGTPVVTAGAAELFGTEFGTGK